MALKPVCEVYDVSKGVRTYRMRITDVTGGEDKAIFDCTADLCPRALDRLKAKIQTGITPPTPKPRKAKEASCE